MLQIGPYKLRQPRGAGAHGRGYRPAVSPPVRGIWGGPGGIGNDQLQPAAAGFAQDPWRSRHDCETEPRSVQIAGNDPRKWPRPPRYNVARGAQIIDINMGCPAKKVCRKAAGSALLADEALVAEILHAVVAAVDVPVTLKIRTGSNPASATA